MKHTSFFSSLSLFGFTAVTLLSTVMKSEAHNFQPSSILSSGKWVKVTTRETGIYEISYDLLKEMGFTNPEMVGVYGKGGEAIAPTFFDGSKAVYSDDLSKVGVIHRDGKLLFYALGPENISFNTANSQFVRNSLNIYSDKGAYFLSDSETPLIIETIDKPSKTPREITLGYDYVYHERDLFQNTTDTGQIFWGEDLKSNTEELKWQLDLPYLDCNAKAKLECKVFAADKSGGTLKYGVTDAVSGNRTAIVRHPAPASGDKENPEFMTMTNAVATLSLESTTPEIYIAVSNGRGDYINLDYWILTYSKHVPDLKAHNLSQQRFVTLMTGAKPGKFSIPGAEEIMVVDVTDPIAPTLPYSEPDKEETAFYFEDSEASRDFIFCDLSMPQKQIEEWKSVANSDLHALSANGADFLIVTTPRYKDFAESLADLHRKYDDMEVMVAVTEDVYNEFSGGIPDPMAYRALMKRLYDAGDTQLKNMLIVGKGYGNFRKILSESDASDYVICFQDNKVSNTVDASIVMDFYGFADDYTYSSLQNNKVQVGVGHLPFYSEKEAGSYLRKVERYLNDNEKAHYLNEIIAIGGVGDSHTHDSQAVQLLEFHESTSPSPQSSTVLAEDAFGMKNAKKRLFDELNYGQLITTYTGHASHDGIDSARDLFRSMDIPSLNNKIQGFMLIYGCDLSHTDTARKGFGEQVVTSTDFGMLGCMMATRTVWSGQNFELSKLLAMTLFTDPKKEIDSSTGSAISYYRTTTPTIGEAYAEAKSISNYINSLAYNYIGDPALKIPVALRRISATASNNGNKIVISGEIMERDTIGTRSSSLEKMKGFNGKIVAKIMSPYTEMVSQDYESNSLSEGNELRLQAPYERLAEFSGVVKEGRYELTLILPQKAEDYAGENLRILLSAYDPELILGASGSIDLLVPDNFKATDNDNVPPYIDATFDESLHAIRIEVSDNAAISPDGVKVILDGKRVNPVSERGRHDATTSFSLYLYPEGDYPKTCTLNVSAVDLAGNTITKESYILISPLQPTLSLEIERKVAVEEARFYTDEPYNAEYCLATIEDSEGNIVWKGRPDKTSWNWDLTDSEGNHVKPGLYKAYIQVMVPGKVAQFSGKINFAVGD